MVYRVLSMLLPLGAILFSVAVVRADVDDSAPDLSAFKLRRVSDKNLSKERANGPITDSAAGAILMRESLISADPKARCSAYAHLFKLISLTGVWESDEVIRLDTVAALALVAEVDKAEYIELMHAYMPDWLGKLFKSAIVELERRLRPINAQEPLEPDVSRETWLELIDCAGQIGLNLDSFLSEPKRARQIQQVRELTDQPIEHEQEGGEGAKGPKPAHQHLNPGSLLNKVFSESEVQQARAQVEQFDDEQLLQVRKRLRADLAKLPDTDSDDLSSEVYLPPQPAEQTGDEEDEATSPGKQDPPEVDIFVPSPIDKNPKRTLTEADAFIDAKTAMQLFTFIKHRIQYLDLLNKDQLEQTPKLPSTLIDECNVHWSYLNDIKIEPNSNSELDLGEHVHNFIMDAENQRMAQRCQQIQLNLDLMQQAIEVMQSKKSFSSIEDLDQNYVFALKQLNDIEPILQAYDETRAIKDKLSQDHHKFLSLHKFIERDGWW